MLTRLVDISLQPNEYFLALMRPIPDFFNQLHKKGELEIPMGFAEVDLGNCGSASTCLFAHFQDSKSHDTAVYGVTYPAADFDIFQKSPPMIVTLVRNSAPFSFIIFS